MYTYSRRAVIPASPGGDATPASNLTLLPLLSLSVVAIILFFFILRMVKRGLHFPNFTWLRGKGKGAKGRLGLSSVELLPTSFKSVPASSPSPFSAAFNLEGNAGKNGNSILLSRSSSLDALPQLSASSPSPKLTSRRRSDWPAPFSLPAFLSTKDKPLHRRSKSLNNLHRTISSSMSTSAPSTPPSKTLLVDVLSSDSSPMSASSDLGTHKMHSASPPLIPGLPIPTSSPEKVKPISKNSTHAWTFDDEGESGDIADFHVTDPLLAAFKHSQSAVQAKPLSDPLPLIMYDQPSSPPPPTPSLAPKRLGTGNPFASLVDSFTSQPFISDRPAAPTCSSSISPSYPPGIELVPMKLTAAQSTPNLLDLSDDDIEVGGYKSRTVGTGSSERTSVVGDLERTHDTHVETAIDLDELSEVVSDPFDDSHAITFPVGDAWNFDLAISLVEDSGISSAELESPLQLSKPVPVSYVPVPASPLSIPSQEKPVEVEVPSPTEPEPLSSSWQWNDTWSPPSIPIPQPALELPSVTPPLDGAEDEHVDSAKPEVGDDLMSFDHEESVSVDEPDRRGSAPVVELEIDVDNPADTWFDEEPTAVWDASWTREDVKEDVLLDMSREKGVEDEEAAVPREEHLDVLDELLVRPSEPVKIHVFEDAETPLVASSSYDNHDNYDINDIHESITTPSNIATPIIHAVTPLPSTPATPNTPLPLPSSPISLHSSPIIEEYSDPEIMPLPDYPPLTAAPTPISPVPVKPQPRSIHQAQTPTPPDSPQPWSIPSSRPLRSLSAVDASALGIPPVDAVPPVPEVRVPEEMKAVVEVESKTDEVECVDAVDGVKEDIVVERPRDIEPVAVDELPREFEEETLTTLQPGLPGSFPTSPSKAPATLPADAAPPSAALTESPSTTKIPQVRAAVPTSNRIRTPRSVIDIALAMQLRPGLGAGADPAWMVRFLMAMFGWLAILVSGDL